MNRSVPALVGAVLGFAIILPSQAADLTEQQLLNRYKQGQVSYTDVVTAQASALSARRTLSQLASSRQAAAVALIQGLGGGWHIETP